jgi:hypothetical protein
MAREIAGIALFLVDEAHVRALVGAKNALKAFNTFLGPFPDNAFHERIGITGFTFRLGKKVKLFTNGRLRYAFETGIAVDRLAGENTFTVRDVLALAALALIQKF